MAEAQLLIDGFASRVAGSGFDAVAETPMLVSQVEMLLDGAAPAPAPDVRTRSR
ncbi:hypothetical protein [Pseudonocardia sp. NPDC046786]|uniref:hypothetical protein n=1 Tax=Pseudonocardia sp. NPDC046786 TaxID=3155471 RepID=UPI0033EF3CC8